MIFLASVTFSQPPFQDSEEFCQNHDYNEVHDRDADVGHKGLVCFGLDLLSRLGQVGKTDDSDQGCILEERDQLVAQSGKDVLDRLRDDDVFHDCDVVHAQAAAGFHLTGIDRHDAASDDLCRVGAGVDAEGEDRDADKVAAGLKDNEAHDQQLNHHRSSADHRRVDLADLVGNAQKNAVVRAFLLVVQRADDRDKNAEDNTDDQRAQCDGKRDADSGEITLPSVRFNKSLVELRSQILE